MLDDVRHRLGRQQNRCLALPAADVLVLGSVCHHRAGSRGSVEGRVQRLDDLRLQVAHRQHPRPGSGAGLPHDAHSSQPRLIRPTFQDPEVVSSARPVSTLGDVSGRSALVAVDEFQRRHAWASLPVAVVRKYGDDQAGQYAALLAYYAFLSVFPLLLVLVSVLGIALSGNTQLQRRILDSSLANFPVIGDQLRSNVHGLNASGVALVVGLVVAFVGARGLADVAQSAFNTLWQVPFTRRPGFPASLLRSLVLLVLIGVGVAVTGWTALVVADGTRAAAARAGLGFIGLAVSCAVFVVGLRLATARAVPTRWLVPGAVVAALVWQVLLAVGQLLVEHSVRGANQVYGAFATVIGLLAWFAIQAQVTLYAVELDVVRAHRLVPRSLAEPLTEADERVLTSYAQAQTRVAGQQVTVTYESDESDGSSDSERASSPRRPRVRTLLVWAGLGFCGGLLAARRRDAG